MKKNVVIWLLVVLAALVFVFGWKSLCEGAEAPATAAVEPPDFSGPDWELTGEKDWYERRGTSLAYRAGRHRDFRHKISGFLGRETEVLNEGVAVKFIWLSGKKDQAGVIFLLTRTYGWVRSEQGAVLRIRDGWSDGKIATIMLIIRAEDGNEYWRYFDREE